MMQSDKYRKKHYSKEFHLVNDMIDYFDEDEVFILIGPDSEQNYYKEFENNNQNSLNSIAVPKFEKTSPITNTLFEIPDNYIAYKSKSFSYNTYEMNINDQTFLKNLESMTEQNFVSLINFLENESIDRKISFEEALKDMKDYPPYFSEIYNYWLEAIERNKKPLIRKYWRQSQFTNDSYVLHSFMPRKLSKIATRKSIKSADKILKTLYEIKHTQESRLIHLIKGIMVRERIKKLITIIEQSQLIFQSTLEDYTENCEHLTTFHKIKEEIDNNFHLLKKKRLGRKRQ